MMFRSIALLAAAASVTDVKGFGLHFVELKGHVGKGQVYGATFSPNSELLANIQKAHTAEDDPSIDVDQCHVNIWAFKGNPVPSLVSTIDVNKCLAIAFSSDSRSLACASVDSHVHIFSLKNETAPILKYSIPVYGVNSVAFSPDGKDLAAGDWSGTVRVYYLKKGSYPRLFLHLKNPTESGCTKLLFSETRGTSKFLSVSTSDGIDHVWTVQDGMGAVRNYMYHLSSKYEVAGHTFDWSHDPKYVAIGTESEKGGKLNVYNLHDVERSDVEWNKKSLKFTIEAPEKTSQFDSVQSVAFSADMKLLATATGPTEKGSRHYSPNATRVYVLGDGPEATLNHTLFERSQVTSVSFSKNGGYLLSTSSWGIMRMYYLNSSAPSCTYVDEEMNATGIEVPCCSGLWPIDGRCVSDFTLV